MTAKSLSHRYIALQTSESDSLLNADGPTESKEFLTSIESVKSIRRERRALQLIIAASIAALCSSLWNVATTGVFKMRFSTSQSVPTMQLSRPDPYIGLNVASIKASSPQPSPILNSPILIAQVNASDANRVYPDIPKVDTPYGRVYPQDHEFLISRDISMVLQFRVMDYGMERCTLLAKLPSSTELVQSEYPRFWDIEQNGLHVNIWRLEEPGELDAKSVSYGSRPRREALVGSWKVEMGHDTYLTEMQNCTSRSLLTFELSCASMDCQLYFKQDLHMPIMGVFIEQSYSL